jgi:hypothetical protein
MRVKDKKHLSWVRSQGCLICERWSQAHHVMFAEPSAMGKKSGDDWAVPLCADHHTELHACGDERTWWDLKGIDPIEWCKLYGSRQ